VHIPEAPRQSLQKLHRARGKIIVCRFDHQPIEFAVESHKGQVVFSLGGAVHALRDISQLRALLFGRALGAGTAEQPLDFAANFKDQQLTTRINVRRECLCAAGR
jgi:hypothetical protein